MFDSAHHQVSENALGRDFIQEVDKYPISDDGNLKSRKFIVSITLIVISSIFTGLGIMDIDTWIFFTGAVGATYLGVNIYQKKTL